MKKLLLLFAVLVLSYTVNAQVFWTEDFNAGSGAQNSLANTYSSGNGNWSVTDLAGTSPDGNQWFVSDQESGQPAGNCGAANQSNPSLHVGNVSTSPAAGIACPAGDCGAAYDASAGAESNRRAESPIIDCSGHTSITMEFLHIGYGQPGVDYVDAVYSDDGGATWNVVPGGAAITSQCCCSFPGFCGGPDPIPCSNPLSGQGYWQLISLSLPASCDNNPNVKVGFRWENNGDNSGSDPSCAIDDVTLSSTTVTPTGPIADFSPDAQTICEGDCITFTDNSSTSDAGGITSWTWTFNGGTPNTFNGQNPPCIDYNTAGTYSVELVVTDANTSDDTITIANYITVEAGPDAGTNDAVTFCDTDAPSDLYNELGGTPDAGGSWAPAMTSGTGVFDPSTDADGTYTYTVTSTNSCPDASADVDVMVNTCNTTEASFNADIQTLCQGGCVTFTDQSTSPNNITDWNWTFTGGTPSTFTGQNPGCVTYDTPGTYAVELSVTDDNGVTNDTVTIATYITVETAPDAGANSTLTLCDNDPVTDLFGALGGTPDPGGTWAPATAAGNGMFEPGVDAAGTYTYTVTSANSCPDALADVNVTVNNCNQPSSNFTASAQTICQGECVAFTDASTGTNISDWSWNFTNAGDPSSFNGQNPPQVCYDQPGTYTVELTVTDDIGTDTYTMDITVNPGPDPEITQSPDQCIGNTITLTTGATGNHTWSDNSTNTTLDVDTDGTYWVEVDDGSGCIGTDTIDMTFHEDLDIELTAVPETCIDAEDGTVITSILQGDGPLSYSWLNGDTSANPSFPPGIYTVTITNDYGCSYSDTVEIDAGTEECPEPSVYIPNIFSPNADGVNDFFEVYGNDIKALTIQIFDRWGKQVYFSTSLDARWDGTRNGKPMNTAVFAYMVTVTYNNGLQEEFSGNVTLVRKE